MSKRTVTMKTLADDNADLCMRVQQLEICLPATRRGGSGPG